MGLLWGLDVQKELLLLLLLLNFTSNLLWTFLNHSVFVMSANWDHTYTLFCNLLLDLVFFQASTYRQTSSFSHNISETPHDGHCDSKCIFALHVTAAATAIRRVWYVYKWATLYLWKLRKTNQMRKAKAVYSKGETTWSLAFCRNWKAGRGVEELSGGRTGGLQVCPDWTLLACSSSRLTGIRLSYLLGVHM